MVLRKLLSLILFAGIALFGSCTLGSSHDEMEEDAETGNDWMLEGRWMLKDMVYEKSANEIIFRADGSGMIDGSLMKWQTFRNEIFISVSDGRSIKTSYTISGATLNISGLGIYVTDLPLTNTWYACDATDVFRGSTFCYYIDEDGEGIRYTFDYMGLAAKTNFKWNRTRSGISIIYRYATEDKECKISGTEMNIEGEGKFTSVLPFYGRWRAVDSSAGLVNEGDDNYSTIEISRKNDKSYFTCTYKNVTPGGHKDISFTGNLQFATTHQHIFEDQQLFIISSDVRDTFTLAYRFFYYPAHDKVYLDLDRNNKFKDFVRYELAESY